MLIRLRTIVLTLWVKHKKRKNDSHNESFNLFLSVQPVQCDNTSVRGRKEGELMTLAKQVDYRFNLVVYAIYVGGVIEL